MLPDHPNWSWHEYGMRVGFWRLKRVFERLKMTPTVTLNARACETYPQVIQAVADAGWELNAHGYDQIPMHKVEDQLGSIKKAIDIIGKFWGRPPRGWFGPGLTQTFDTLDYLSRGRHRIHRRLGARRRAGDAEDHAQAGGRAALQFRAARHRHDGAAEPSVGRDVPALDGRVRLPLRGIDGPRRRSCRSPCIPISPASRTASARRAHLRGNSVASPASPAGTARKSSTGISARRRRKQA